jgi:hypothetical protein
LTHAEARELVLDLAYGELAPHVAAEVERHVETCPECREEQRNIGFVRASFAPIREVEQPSAMFDAHVAAAARTEAQLEHDGNIGQVVEVSASAAPAGLRAASVNAMAAPVTAKPLAPKSKWRRIAAVASVAAAAGLALVVGTTLRRPEEQAKAVPAENYRIKIEAPQIAAPAAQPPAEPPEQKVALAPPPPPKPAEAERKQKKAAPRRDVIPMGAGGDAADTSQFGLRAGNASAGAGAANQPAKDALDRGAAQQKEVQFAPPPPPASPPRAEAPAEPAPAAPASRAAVAAKAAPPEPGALETRAESARHAGNYALAAGLYRQAADSRGEDPSTAAWDLAHAVECLAAAGSFDEAKSVRDQLTRSYPEQKSAAAAAARALRELPGN